MDNKGYLYSLTGGSGGGGNATETIRKNIVKDNLIRHSEFMDFPELLEAMNNNNIEYSEYDLEHFPSRIALRLVMRQNYLSCSIPLNRYMIDVPEYLTEERYYTLSYYYRSNMIDNIELDISVDVPISSQSDEQIPGTDIYRRVITFAVNGNRLNASRLSVKVNLKNYMMQSEVFLSSLKLEQGDIVTAWTPVKEPKSVHRITAQHTDCITLSNVQPNSDIVIITTCDFIEGRRLEVIHVGTSWEDTVVVPVFLTDEEFYTVVSYNDGMLDIHQQASTRFYQNEMVDVTIIGNNLKVEE